MILAVLCIILSEWTHGNLQIICMAGAMIVSLIFLSLILSGPAKSCGYATIPTPETYEEEEYDVPAVWRTGNPNYGSLEED
jgi:hypothetical protein